MPLVSFVVALLVVALLFWAIQQLLVAFGIGEPVRTVVLVIFVLLVVLWLLGVVGVLPDPWLRLR